MKKVFSDSSSHWFPTSVDDPHFYEYTTIATLVAVLRSVPQVLAALPFDALKGHCHMNPQLPPLLSIFPELHKYGIEILNHPQKLIMALRTEVGLSAAIARLYKGVGVTMLSRGPYFGVLFGTEKFLTNLFRGDDPSAELTLFQRFMILTGTTGATTAIIATSEAKKIADQFETKKPLEGRGVARFQQAVLRSLTGFSRAFRGGAGVNTFSREFVFVAILTGLLPVAIASTKSLLNALVPNPDSHKDGITFASSFFPTLAIGMGLGAATNRVDYLKSLAQSPLPTRVAVTSPGTRPYPWSPQTRRFGAHTIPGARGSGFMTVVNKFCRPGWGMRAFYIGASFTALEVATPGSRDLAQRLFKYFSGNSSSNT